MSKLEDGASLKRKKILEETLEKVQEKEKEQVKVIKKATQLTKTYVKNLTRDPKDSIHYDAIFNPYGAPPPGKKQRYKSEVPLPSPVAPPPPPPSQPPPPQEEKESPAPLPPGQPPRFRRPLCIPPLPPGERPPPTVQIIPPRTVLKDELVVDEFTQRLEAMKRDLAKPKPLPPSPPPVSPPPVQEEEGVEEDKAWTEQAIRSLVPTAVRRPVQQKPSTVSLKPQSSNSQQLEAKQFSEFSQFMQEVNQLEEKN